MGIAKGTKKKGNPDYERVIVNGRAVYRKRAGAVSRAAKVKGQASGLSGVDPEERELRSRLPEGVPDGWVEDYKAFLDGDEEALWLLRYRGEPRLEGDMAIILNENHPRFGELLRVENPCSWNTQYYDMDGNEVVDHRRGGMELGLGCIPNTRVEPYSTNGVEGDFVADKVAKIYDFLEWPKKYKEMSQDKVAKLVEPFEDLAWNFGSAGLDARDDYRYAVKSGADVKMEAIKYRNSLANLMNTARFTRKKHVEEQCRQTLEALERFDKGTGFGKYGELGWL